MNRVVKYHNDLNTIPMRKWTSEEQNFFFSIVTQARDKGTTPLIFSKEQLVDLANYSLERNKDLHTIFKNLTEKLAIMRYREQTSNSYTIMMLFQYFEAKWTDDLSDMTLEVQVSERFDYIINKLNAEFTQFELAQFTNIRSTYAKEMFKFLKQWRTIGKKEYNLAEFREMLQIPKSYKAKDVSERVLKPIIEELDDYFIGIKVRPIKSRKRGTPIIAYEFTWQQEKTGEYVEGKYDNKKTEILPDWFSSSDNTSGKQTTEKLSGEELEQKVNNIKNILKNRD